MTFAERLRDLRGRAGLTQAALAAGSGLSLGAIRNYEQGIREPYWQALFWLAAALGTSCEAFAVCVDQAAAEKPAPKKRKGAR
jgi:transcriptional regulator with XRE-family HTH domain